MSADGRNSQRDVLDLAAVGDGTELDDGVEGNLQPGQLLLGRFQEVAQEAPEKLQHRVRILGDLFKIELEP